LPSISNTYFKYLYFKYFTTLTFPHYYKRMHLTPVYGGGNLQPYKLQINSQ